MTWKSIALGTKDRTLFGAWDALNRALTALAATIPAPAPPATNPLVVPAANGSEAPIQDGMLVMLDANSSVTPAIYQGGKLCVGAADETFAPAVIGDVKIGGLKLIQMDEGLPGAGPPFVVGTPIHMCATAGKGTTIPNVGAPAMGILWDTTEYTLEGGWRALVLLTPTAIIPSLG